MQVCVRILREKEPEVREPGAFLVGTRYVFPALVVALANRVIRGRVFERHLSLIKGERR